ncbi:MAG: hypothetical protein J6Y12_06770, partial [Lachnospiraceae bacterium]|nr:hypothetical protein [Lachnospiraceae bacterium]
LALILACVMCSSLFLSGCGRTAEEPVAEEDEDEEDDDDDRHDKDDDDDDIMTIYLMFYSEGGYLEGGYTLYFERT